MGLRHGSLFSGIGGFDLAAEWMGWKNIFHCEWNEFGQRVLKHYWPNADTLHDITKTDFTKYAGSIDIISGGFPCQPYSSAGKRLGKEDERHLWPEMLRAIREIKPTWFVGENVRGLVNWNGGLVFDEVQSDLEAEEYEVQPFLLPAAAVNAPHRRDRVWFVAYSKHNRYWGKKREKLAKENGIQEKHRQEWSWAGMSKRTSSTNKRLQQSNRIYNKQHATNTDSVRLQQCKNSAEMGGRQSQVWGAGSEFADAIKADDEKWATTNTDRPSSERRNSKTKEKRKEQERRIKSLSQHTSWQVFPTKPPICGGDDGIPRELDSITFPKWRNESIKAYGNAIVPQVALQIFKTIEQYENIKRGKDNN